jgi:hypothetical protein
MLEFEPAIVIYVKTMNSQLLEESTGDEVTLNVKYPKLKGFLRKLASDDFLGATSKTQRFTRNCESKIT